MIGVVRDRRAVEMKDRIAPPLMLVRELRSQTVDIIAPALEREVSEHGIKRTVLEHQHDDVLDLL
jgi:hypothetical protein